MKKNFFIEELNRRGKTDDNAYSLIGTELKRVRMSQSQTLSSVAGDLCSVSYLCKVEKAQLKPNRYMLNEICKKLNVSSPKINLLFELKDILQKMVKSYYLDDREEILKIYTQCQEFDNYRTKLIDFIYYIYIYQLGKAESIAKELFRITSVMHDDELGIFIVFHSILKYYEESYMETLDNIYELENYNNVEDTLAKIAAILTLECYVKLNSPMTLVCSSKLLDLFLKGAEYSKADYVRYLEGLYMLHNSMIISASKSLQNLQTKEFRYSLEFFIDIKTKKLKEKTYYEKLRPFAKLIYGYTFHREKYLDTFLKMNKDYFYDCDFSYNIANYLTCSDDTERYKELSSVVIPNLSMTNNKVEKLFFLKEYCRISSKFGRYKNFTKAYASLMGGLED